MAGRRQLRVASPVDLGLTTSPLRHGAGDPTARFDGTTLLRATRTPDGPATVRVEPSAGGFVAEAWGPGADWALGHVPGVIGLEDDPSGFEPRHHPVVEALARRAPGLRLPATHRVVEALLPAVLRQRVTSFEAVRSYRQLVTAYGEPAPGPGGLLLPPAPEVLAGVPYYDLHVLGVEKKRADTLRRVCAHAGRLEEAAASLAGLRRTLRAIPGVGVWTVAEVCQVVRADADAVSVGDYGLKHVVAWALAREPRGTDARMLELLEPFAPHRGRVCRLLVASGIEAPRFGPRRRIEPIARR